MHALPNTLNKKAEGLLEPLLEGEEDDDSSASSDESSLYSSSTVSVQVKPTAMQWIKTAVGELLYSILTWYPIIFVWSGKCIDATALILFIYQPTYIIYIQFINFSLCSYPRFRCRCCSIGSINSVCSSCCSNCHVFDTICQCALCCLQGGSYNQTSW